jgi:hypothetical protein
MSSSNIFCSSCGARNDSDAAFCSSCGARLVAPPPAPPMEKVPPPPTMEKAPPPPPAAGVAPSAAAPAPSKKSSPLPLLLAVGAIVVLLIVVLVEAVVILLPQGTTAGGEAIITALSGQTMLQKAGQSEWTEVVGSVAVEAGDRIRTSEASYAVIDFFEGTATELSALTELRIDDLQILPGRKVVIKLDLELGEIWNRIAELPTDSVHEISTLAATVTCHGSQYGLAVNEIGTTWVRGHEGKVELAADGSTVSVAPGDTLVVELGSPPVSYASVAMVPTSPAGETPGEGAQELGTADMPTFLNQPLPTGTPTNTPSPTATSRPVQPTPSPTATRRPQPTPTTPACPPSCPTFRINVPSGAPPYGLFGIEWDVLGGSVPAGYSYVLEFSQDQASWGRTPPLRWKDAQGIGELWETRGHMNAEIHGAGPGNWYWRVCIVQSETGPSCCCGPSHTIVHQRDDSC